MENFLSSLNDFLYSYILIFILLGCGLWFTVKSRFVQFRSIGEMFRLIFHSNDGSGSGKHISSFQAFAVSLASRVGTGNLAGVATAIAIGGPGAVFWMWMVALVGSASSFVESTLAQYYKRADKDSFVGGPAYYMEKGLKCRWMGVVFAILITFTFSFAFNSVQSNTIGAAIQSSFGIDHKIVGIIITVLTGVIIFGGIQRVAKVCSVIVPMMAIGYILLALYVVLTNITALPYVLELIFKSAFGWEQAVGGGMGVAVMQGVRRGLFSNEAGLGSAPNAAATASVSHPVKQGLIQALGVFIDTLVICSCTAFIILISGLYTGTGLNGVLLTQEALAHEIGPSAKLFVTIAIFFFAFSTIIGNYYYGETNLHFISPKKWIIFVYRIALCGVVLCGSLISLDMAWNLADIFMGLMGLCNLFAIVLLSPKAFALLKDYRAQKKAGIKEPHLDKWWD